MTARKRSISVSALTSPVLGLDRSLSNDYVCTNGEKANNNSFETAAGNCSKERRFSKSRSLSGKDSVSGGVEGPYDLDVDEMMEGGQHGMDKDIYGGVADRDRGSNYDLAARSARVSYLSTITEQYSPYGTERSRKISAYPPTAEAVFKQGGLPLGT